MSHESNLRQNAYALSISFTQSHLFVQCRGGELLAILDELEAQIRRGLPNRTQTLLTDYLYYLQSLHELDCQYHFNLGWDAHRDQQDLL